MRAGTVVSRRGGQINSTGVTTTRYPNGTLSDTALNAWTQNIATPAVVAGYNLQWSAPPATFGTVTATFGIRQGTSGAFAPKTINTGPPYSVYLGDLAVDVPYEYEINYTLGGRTIATQRGNVMLDFTASATTTTVTNSVTDAQPTPINPVSTVSGRNGIATATAQIVYPAPGWNGISWMYDNRILTSYATIDSGLLRSTRASASAFTT